MSGFNKDSSLRNSVVLCLLVLLNVYFTHGKPQEGGKKEENGDEGCRRYPQKNTLFSSDNFPANYNTETDCRYVMRAEKGKRVLLTFYMFETETSSRCLYDRVEVIDSDGSTIHRFCGKNSNNINVNSSREHLEIKFVTDKVSTYKGFLASWQEVENDFVLPNDASEGSYYLTYPTTFMQDSDEKVCVDMFDLQDDAELTASVYVEKKRDPDDDSEDEQENWRFKLQDPNVQEKVRLSPSESSKCFNLTIPKLDSSSSSKGLINFKIEGSSIKVNSFKSISIGRGELHPLIQTDKGVYKAKDTVKFRLLILDDEIKPSKEIKSIDQIWIEDPKSRRMKQWDKVDLERGMLQEELRLSEEPELGSWSIHFESESGSGPTSGVATFTVSEYVLPKFEVTITPPPAVLKDADTVEFKICGEFTHGGSVRGEISSNFTSTRVIRTWPKRREDKRVISVTTVVGDDEECGVVSLTRDQLLHLTEKVDNFALHVTFTERGTGTTAEASSRAQLQDQPFKIKTKEGSQQFIVGGFPYTGEFEILEHDDTPREEKIEVCVAFYKDVQKIRDIFNRRGIWNMDEEEIAETGQKMADLKHSEECREILSTSGKIPFYVAMDNVPEDVVKMIVKLTAVDFTDNEETGMKQPTKKLNVVLTHSKADFSLSLNDKQTDKVSCGTTFHPKIYFSAKVGEKFNLNFLALSKGQIIESGSLLVEVEKKDGALESLLGASTTEISPIKSPLSAAGKIVSYQELEFNISHSVSPSLKLIIFANIGNTTLGDSFTYSVEPCQRHKVSLQLSEKKVNPGAPVTLSLTSSEDNSLCGISVVDKSVELLGNKNKISGDTISKLQAQIGDRKTSRYENYWEYQRKCPQSYEVIKVFENTGIRMITDLPVVASCELLTDSVNFEDLEEYSDYGVQYSLSAAPAPLSNRVAAFSADAVQMKMSSPELSAESAPTLQLRNYFPEHWLFEMITLDSQMSDRELVAPHTLTTWIADAFCINEDAGIGVAKTEELLVNQDFFAEINLPYSVKRGEVFPLNISIFNYVNQELPIRVDLTTKASEIVSKTTSEDVCVKARNSRVLSWKVSALELGELNVTVRATITNGIEGCADVEEGDGFTDALVKPLRVKPEGVPVEIVQSEFKCLGDDEESEGDGKFKFDRLELPDDVVEDSERAWVYVTGDVMAPALDNVGNLVRLPTGCGEQNMVGLVPNIYLLNYLQGVGKSLPEIEEKAKNFMNIGYKRQQKYRHSDGSYSIWGGKGNKDGSTWLTAFVVKAFSESSKYISVDTRLVQQSVDWLSEWQMENGCYAKRGYVHSSYLKGGLSDDSLTAFVLSSLITVRNNMKEVEIDERSLNRAFDCMNKNINTTDLYTTIVAANTAARHGHDERAAELMKIIEEQSNTTTGLKFWETKKETVDCDHCWWRYRPSSEAVEMTAYNILTYVHLGQLPLALDSVKWLARQRNSQGGFVSTQDTVVALEALSEYMRSVTATTLDLTLDISEDDDKLDSMMIDDSNGLLLQSQKLTKLPASLDVSSSGSGCSLVQTVLRYNTKQVQATSGFHLEVSTENINSVESDPSLTVCARYTGNQEKTGMVLIEVELVTGWEAVDPERLINEVDSGVRRVETDEKENKIILYFDEMSKRQTCVSLELKDVMTIEDPAAALVEIYDYYNREDAASTLYNIE